MEQPNAKSLSRFRLRMPDLKRIPFSAKYILIIVLGIVLLTGMIWFVSPYVRQFFAGLNPSINVSTLSPSEVEVGDEFSVVVSLSNQKASAYELYLEYDGEYIEYFKEYSDADLSTGFSQLNAVYFLSQPLIEEVIPIPGSPKKKLHILIVSQEKLVPTTIPINLTFRVKNVTLTENKTVDFVQLSESKIAGAAVSDADNSETASYFDYSTDSILKSSTVIVASSSPTDPGTCACTGETVSSDTCSVGYGPVCSLVDADNNCACQALDPTLTPTNTPAPDNSITPEEGTPTPTTEPTTESPTPIPTDIPDTESPTPSPTNTPIPTQPAGGSRGDVELKLKLRFQGVVKQPAEEYRSLNTKVILSAADKSFRQESALAFLADGEGLWTGTFSTKNVPLGAKYALLIKGPKHLMKKICDSNPTESVAGNYNCTSEKIELKSGTQELDLSRIILLAGDIPVQDGIIDSLDAVYVRNNFGSQNTGSVSRGDLNLDGIVHAQDMVLMLKALEFKYDEK